MCIIGVYMHHPEPEISAIPCYVLSFTEREAGTIKSFLSENGYEPDSSGLKAWLLDEIENSEEENRPDPVNTVISGIVHHIADNPEILRAASSAGKTILGNFLKRKK